MNCKRERKQYKHLCVITCNMSIVKIKSTLVGFIAEYLVQHQIFTKNLDMFNICFQKRKLISNSFLYLLDAVYLFYFIIYVCSLCICVHVCGWLILNGKGLNSSIKKEI